MILIKLGKSSIDISASDEYIQYLKLEFEQQHCIHLPQFIDSSLLSLIQSLIESGDFYERTDEGIATESCMKESFTLGMMELLINRTKLFQFVEKITDCGRIGCFSGRLFRMQPGRHYDSWHDDLVEHRMLAVSINLSRKVYHGGVLQIRDSKSKQIVHEVANTGLGDCIIFRLAPTLEHRVTNLEGVVTRTTYAGWFRSQPNFLARLKRNTPLTATGRK